MSVDWRLATFRRVLRGHFAYTRYGNISRRAKSRPARSRAAPGPRLCGRGSRGPGQPADRSILADCLSKTRAGTQRRRALTRPAVTPAGYRSFDWASVTAATVTPGRRGRTVTVVRRVRHHVGERLQPLCVGPARTARRTNAASNVVEVALRTTITTRTPYSEPRGPPTPRSPRWYALGGHHEGRVRGRTWTS